MKIAFKERMEGEIAGGAALRKSLAEFNITAVSNISVGALKTGRLPFKIEGVLFRCCCNLHIYSGRSAVPLAGFLDIDIVRRKLIYSFRFGEHYEYLFKGEKNVRFGGVRELLRTMTYLPGEVSEVAGLESPQKAVFRFNLKKDLLPMILSFRIRLSG